MEKRCNAVVWNFYQGIYKEKGNLGVLKENLIVTQRPRPVCILGSNVCLESTKTSVVTSGLISEAVSVMIVSRNDWGGGDECHSRSIFSQGCEDVGDGCWG